jgi:membrane protein required for colicin V production
MADTNVSLVDVAIIVVLALSVLVGLAQGFFRSFCSLGGLILGLAIAEWNYPLVANPLNRLIHNDEISNIVGFILIAIVIMAIAGILGSFFAKTLKAIGLGCLDRLAGAVFGFFQGILLVTLAILVTVAFYPQAHWLLESRLPRHFFAACHLSTQVSPEILAKRVREGLKTLEGEAPQWMHPHEGRT